MKGITTLPTPFAYDEVSSDDLGSEPEDEDQEEPNLDFKNEDQANPNPYPAPAPNPRPKWAQKLIKVVGNNIGIHLIEGEPDLNFKMITLCYVIQSTSPIEVIHDVGE